MVPFKEDGKVPRSFPEERGERKQYALAAMGKARIFYLFFGRYYFHPPGDEAAFRPATCSDIIEGRCIALLSTLRSQVRFWLRRQLGFHLTSDLRLLRSSRAQDNDRDTESVPLPGVKGMKPGIAQSR